MEIHVPGNVEETPAIDLNARGGGEERHEGGREREFADAIISCCIAVLASALISQPPALMVPFRPEPAIFGVRRCSPCLTLTAVVAAPVHYIYFAPPLSGVASACTAAYSLCKHTVTVCVAYQVCKDNEDRVAQVLPALVYSCTLASSIVHRAPARLSRTAALYMARTRVMDLRKTTRAFASKGARPSCKLSPICGNRVLRALGVAAPPLREGREGTCGSLRRLPSHHVHA
ncbi:hypothetical protein DFH09DRAFT_1337030 [Mycena vulgaris]|nr:hypothetical protein DFH09DRAFT_1337030 [Mycena vulgaris]